MSADAIASRSLIIPVDVNKSVREEFLRRLESLLKDGSEPVALECGQIDHLSSAHINLLWSSRQLCEESGVSLRLKATSDYILRVLKVLDLDEFFILDTPDPSAPQKTSSWPELLGSLDVYRDSFAADVESINAAMDRFLAILKVLGLPSSTRYVLRTLFYEVVTNIRLHASPLRGLPISFSARFDRVQIVLRFADHGPPFDPTGYDPAMAPQSDDTGRRSLGIMILRKLADDISYERLDDTNVLTLEKKWRSPKWMVTA